MRGPPLWPTGHLPLKGGDRMSLRLSPIPSVAGKSGASQLPISPLEGEMPGRAEGGASRRPMRLRGASRILTQ
ncbi:MAG: lytic murein transglycosylase [Mesorhizobium sp.]|nr:MAG: lytic murein transglycosylase [Mesorhizobium sp.]RWD98975.1 MAG: lytic murein transglycosylase [Mesorhizobium sp.]